MIPNIFRHCPFLAALVPLVLLASPLHAAEDGKAVVANWPEWVSIINGLEINPKLITEPGGDNTTFGVEYKFQREIRPRSLNFISEDTELGISVRSEGLIVAEERKSPNHLIAHGLRLSAIDLLPAKWTTNAIALKENQVFRERIDREYFEPWQRNAEALKNLNPVTDRAKVLAIQKTNTALASQASIELKEYGVLQPDAVSRLWWLQTPKGKREWASEIASKVVKERFVFLNFDLDANVEHDQALTNIQFVGAAQLRGKFLIPELDWPFKILRLGGDIQHFANRNGGPYFWGGVGVVDGSDNDARQALTTDHKIFPRAHFGVFYRTELISISESKSVAAELQWRYYHEFDAPGPIRARKLDATSYFKATVLFPGNYFLEYTDGKLPLDVEGASTVSVGWRHNL